MIKNTRATPLMLECSLNQLGFPLEIGSCQRDEQHDSPVTNSRCMVDHRHRTNGYWGQKKRIPHRKYLARRIAVGMSMRMAIEPRVAASVERNNIIIMNKLSTLLPPCLRSLRVCKLTVGNNELIVVAVTHTESQVRLG